MVGWRALTRDNNQGSSPGDRFTGLSGGTPPRAARKNRQPPTKKNRKKNGRSPSKTISELLLNRTSPNRTSTCTYVIHKRLRSPAPKSLDVFNGHIQRITHGRCADPEGLCRVCGPHEHLLVCNIIKAMEQITIRPWEWSWIHQKR